MKQHQLEDGRLCQREQTPYGAAYDPTCPKCQAEEAAEPIVAHKEPAKKPDQVH